MTCKNCGASSTEIKNGVVYCSYCGSELIDQRKAFMEDLTLARLEKEKASLLNDINCRRKMLELEQMLNGNYKKKKQ